MKYPVTQIDCSAITDWDSFHDAFATAFSFPDYYGRNMNAWIDCMSDLDSPGVVQLDSVKPFRKRCPDIERGHKPATLEQLIKMVNAVGLEVTLVVGPAKKKRKSA